MHLENPRQRLRPGGPTALAAALLAALAVPDALADYDGDGGSSPFAISSASWSSRRDRLSVSGTGDSRLDVTVVNAYDTAQVLGTDDIGRRGWSITDRHPNPVPCRVRATQSDGQSDEQDVTNAPADCAPKGPPTGNQPPVANPDSYATDEDTPLVVSAPGVLGNDTDPDNDTLTASGDTTSAMGAAVVMLGDGSFTYDPTGAPALQALNTGESADDTFDYTVSDGNGGTDTATVTVTVAGVDEPAGNQPPTANANGPYSGTVGSAIAFSSAGSSDSDGTITAFAWEFGDGGTSAQPNPSHTYTASGNYTVTLTVTDDAGDSGSDNTTATVTNTSACPPFNGNAVPGVSINSTAQSSDCQNTHVVAQQPQVANNSYSVLAINDLGMHCGDLDTRVSSILPPFQVLLAQVIQKGAEPALNPPGISLRYSAASNPSDPILGNPELPGVMGDGSSYKTNFWNTVINGKVYNAFYPIAIDGMMSPDKGLPVPNVEELYIANGNVVPGGIGIANINIAQHAMPGMLAPYSANTPQTVQEHYNDKPFFVDFPFGYVANDVNWHEAAGIPFAAFDDFGRENAYPLVRVEARNGNTTVATLDTVLPISGEASCTNCHSTRVDYESVHGANNGFRSSQPTDNLAAVDANLPLVAESLDDPDPNMPPKVSLEYAADINILRLHDARHGARYVSPTGNGTAAADPCTFPDTDPANPNPENGSATCLTNRALEQDKPVVCQVCHYTPALDLAQVGPMTGPEGTTAANGRNQLAHSSNSNVMHSHHGGTGLFDTIPAPIQSSNGTVTNQSQRLAALENSCYQCHPGKNTQCLRGAMFNGDMLCSDCHGNMAQVGADFSANVSPTNPGAFVLNQGNFYDPTSGQPRVPWANEPGCGSCHTGDVNTNLTTMAGTLVNKADTNGNTDNIRLRQAFRTGDGKATPIVPTNKRFAEPAVPASFNGFANPGAGNPKLYRVSTGHGGVMCEGCHGATHAEWPNANPAANDNVAANQLQGHSGTIVECTTCHGTAMDSRNTLGGPHGMHPVGDNTSFARGGHENVDRSGCSDCHGPGGRGTNVGTVLSVAKADRNLRGTLVRQGEPVGCSVCH